MTTARLFARLRALPEDVTEREARRAIFKGLALRFVLGFLALTAWHWVARRYLQIEPAFLEGLAKRAGSVAIFVITVYPLIRILRMSDEEYERVLGAESTTAG